MNRIKELRHMKTPTITQQKLAELVGVSRSTIAMWETGKNEPDNATLVKLAEIFDVSTDYILGVPSEYGHYSALSDMYYRAVMTWSKDMFFSADETVTIRMHFSDLLLRYKELIEETSRNKSELKLYLKAMDTFNRESSSPLSTQELIEQFWKQKLTRNLDNLTGWIDFFVFHLSKTMANENIAKQMPANKIEQASENYEIEEYRRRLLLEQSQAEQSKTPIPVFEDELDDEEKSFMASVRTMTPGQQEAFFEHYSQLRMMKEPQKAASTVSVPSSVGDKAPESELPNQS